MLKRHQACIDLEKNVLRIQGIEVPFLAEHELPNKARQMEELAEELDQASATGNLPLAPKTPAKPSFTGQGQKLGSAPAASGSGAGAPAATGGIGNHKFPEADVQAVSRVKARMMDLTNCLLYLDHELGRDSRTCVVDVGSCRRKR
jgi:DNA damage-inducible protein 1